MTDILMPALSPTMEEGNLAKWHVKVGDKVESGQVIAEIETDKATMEVEAVDEGEIGELLVEEGAQGVKVGAPIAKMAGEGSSASPPSRPADAPPPPAQGDEKAKAAAPDKGAEELPPAPKRAQERATAWRPRRPRPSGGRSRR